MSYTEKPGYFKVADAQAGLHVHSSRNDIVYAVLGQDLRERLRADLSGSAFEFLCQNIDRVYRAGVKAGRKETVEQRDAADWRRLEAEARRDIVGRIIRCLDEEFG